LRLPRAAEGKADPEPTREDASGFGMTTLRGKEQRGVNFSLRFRDFTDNNSRPLHVGIFKKKYIPRKPNTVSGAHAANRGGNCPTAPIASVSADAAQ
jgi:hypothetical protein